MGLSFIRIIILTCVGCLPFTTSGCASIAEGITRGVTESEDAPEKRLCELHSPAFPGIAQSFHAKKENDNGKVIHKVMMIHGIGGTASGYSARFQNNLITALGFTRVSNMVKKIELRSDDYPKSPMGYLQVTRYQNETRDREVHFFELTWSVITQPDKDFLAASDTSLYSANRAALNQELKTFVNNHVVDPAIYTGTKKNMIVESASQSICWMLHKDWSDLPEESTSVCRRSNTEDMFNLLSNKGKHDFSFVTHSLGSRIIVDMLDTEVERLHKSQTKNNTKLFKKLHGLIKNFEFHIYMMSNQLPLLQLGRAPATVTRQYDQYCDPAGKKYHARYLNKLFIVAFSDPNDLLSYNIPYNFANNFLDSRLCPEVVNVSVSVTEPIDIFGIGKFANPLSAHTDYQNDERVVGIITHGIGQRTTYPAVAETCKWLEAIPE